MNQEEILNFIATLDQQLLAAAAVLLLLLLLFWRVLRRTSRVEREVARLSERLERIREEVRSISGPGPLSVAPVKEVPATDEEVEQAPPEVPDLLVEQPEEEDVLSRAVASLAEMNADEDSDIAESNDDFSFDSSIAEPNEIAASIEEPSVPEDKETFSFDEPEEASSPVEESVAPAAVEPEPVVEESPAGVVRLDGDPARPGVSMVRCLSCNYKLAYPEKLSGKRVRCPSCRTGLDLP